MVNKIRPALASGLILAVTLSSGCLEVVNAELLTPAADRSRALIDQMLAGDIADAFAQFRDNLAQGSSESSASGLTDEQRAAIEGLQAELDAGALTQDEFVAQVLELIGDPRPDSAFAGSNLLGTPFEGSALSLAADTLGLTPSQQRQALAIYRALHGDIAKAREIVKDEILAMLSTQQAALLSQLATELLDRLGIPEAQRPIAAPVFETIMSRLDLSALQHNQINSLRSGLSEAAAGLHASAREQFLALLTDRQLELLSTLEDAPTSKNEGDADTTIDVISDLIAN